MTKMVRLVNMKEWTPEDMRQRLSQLVGSGGDETEARARTRQRILDAATDHFARYGYRRASIGEIARDAGVGKGTLYLYFESKQALLMAAVSREKFGLVGLIAEVYALPAEQQLEAFLQVSLLFALEAPLSSALMRGDRELEAVFTDMQGSGQITEEDHARGDAFMAHLVLGAAPHLSEAMAVKIGHMIAAIARLPAHLSTMDGLSTGMTNEEFARFFSKVLARGVAALEAES